MKTILKIEGMHCAGCAGSIERAVGRVEGVKEVKVDREAGRAVIDHEARVSRESIVALVNEIGFTAHPVEK
ncbi:MAG: heavy-metal-associated domain-containing protein [Phycisphaeraceae bacterium]|nr:heavy-metal-associated domain-containing protein [Phycisphaeraceae bacterium]MCW5767079.1 heavy-metal-associated domain-containing protein [Phycisphaeraceae bacterium]